MTARLFASLTTLNLIFCLALMLAFITGCDRQLFRDEDRVSLRKVSYFGDDQTVEGSASVKKESTGLGFGLPQSGAGN